MQTIRAPQQNIAADFAAIHLALLTSEIAEIHSKLQKTVYNIKETAAILRRLSVLPNELTQFSNNFDLTDTQRISIEQLAENISKLTRIANSLLTDSEIARNTTPEFQPASPKASSDKNSVELKKWTPAQATAYSLNDELLLIVFSFLSFGNLANCLRVNKFFKEVTPLQPIHDRSVFLNKERTIFLDLLRFNRLLSRPPQLCEILDERNKVQNASRFHFLKSEKTKLEPVVDALQKRIGLKDPKPGSFV